MQTLTALSLNVWFDNEQNLGIIREIVLKEEPDLVGLQECSLESAELLASTCGMYCAGHSQSRQPVLSRWPVKTLKLHGFKLCIPNGVTILWYNVHLPSHPYAPYALHKVYTQLADPFEDPFQQLFNELNSETGSDASKSDSGNCSKHQSPLIAGTLSTTSGSPGLASTACPDGYEEDLISLGSPPAEEENFEHMAATEVESCTQLPMLIDIFNDMKIQKNSMAGVEHAVLLTGDFNAASHLDYGDGPSWPCSMLCASHCLLDSFAEARRLGFAAIEPSKTWPAREDQGPTGIHDRIDFIYTSETLQVKFSRHLDDSNCIENWPSDHRAVLSVFDWSFA